MGDANLTVNKLLGNFFQRNTSGDKEGVKAVIAEIEEKLKSGEIDSDIFKDYFNNMYAGRSAVNMTGIAKDYPRESIIRELLQNTFGCDYDTPDIKVMIEFLDEGQVKLTYNEVGFKLEQVFYYLSVGRNEGDRRREGRFGLGAKSVFANVDWFKMRSNNYSLRVVNDEGTLKVRELELQGEHFNHTEIVFALPEEEQATLHENLVTLTSKKGSYINIVDLCFAFIKKKYLTAEAETECPERTFNIAVINYGKPEVVYKIQQFRKDENDIPKIRFIENGKSVADFIHIEHEGFVYLVPFAISGSKRETAKVLMSKYNYFSTFELTGFVRANNKDFVDEKLSAFFVSVPNKYITNNRSGIRHDCLEECSARIEKGILFVAEEYKNLFLLEMIPNPEKPDRYMLRPKQYVFEFFYNYVHTSGIVQCLREKFADNVSIIFPDNPEPVLVDGMRKNGFFSERDNVSKDEHDDGTAEQALVEDIDQMNNWYGRDDDHVLVSRYRWVVPGTEEKGEEFLYAFYWKDNRYLMASDGNKKVKDYELSAGFRSIISLKLKDCIVNGQVADENALGKAFEVIDEMFGENYRISMKYFQFVITSGAAQVQFEISKINISNMKKAYDVLANHEMRFESHAVFNQVVMLMLNSFTNGKDTIYFMKELKSQGADVTLALDINKRYRFQVYGKQFMIPPNITNAELMDIVGDVYSLIESGMLNNRVFDFIYTPGRFNFDVGDITTALGSTRMGAAEIETLMKRIYVCDLGMDKIALLDASDKLKKIVDLSQPIDPADREKSSKFVILRDGMSKAQYAGFVEFILTGENRNLLRSLYSGTEEPNIMLLDQIPYYYKPVPSITRKEFDYLRSEVRKIAPFEKSNPKAYRNCFARDINAKIYGYGAVCPCCGYEPGVLNSFVIKPFSIGIMSGEKEQKFNFSLYLCRNDAAAAAGWIIDDVSIGGMLPFLWLEEIGQIDTIPPEFMYCRIKYRRQVTYDVAEPAANGGAPEQVYEGAPEVLDLVLTPMMAAKWYEDNTSKSAVAEQTVQPSDPAQQQPMTDASQAAANKPSQPAGQKLTPRHPATEPMMPEDPGSIKM